MGATLTGLAVTKIVLKIANNGFVIRLCVVTPTVRSNYS